MFDHVVAGTDGAVPIDDFTPETIDDLVERIRASQREEEFVYREAELDDLWRIVDTALFNAHRDLVPRREVEHLQSLLAVVRRAHDLVGHGHPEADPDQAAQLLSSGAGSPR
jgi:hypothetical protein